MMWVVGAVLTGANVLVCVLAVVVVVRAGPDWASVRRSRTPLRVAGTVVIATGFLIAAVGQWSASSPAGDVGLLIAVASLASAIAVTQLAIDGGGFPVAPFTALGLAWLLATLDLYVVGVHLPWSIGLAALTGAICLGVAVLDIGRPPRQASPSGVAGERWLDDRWPDRETTTTTWVMPEEDDW